MQFLVDYFPLILFFVAFKLQGIFVATACVAIAASVAQIAYVRWRHGKVAAVHWLSFAIIATFGGATLLLHDETFIKWKPTVLYWLFALGAGRRQARFPQESARRAAQGPDAARSHMVATDLGLGRVPAAMGIANLYVAANFTTDTWVNFKVWGGMGLFMLAAVGTVASVARYLPGES